MLREYKSKQRPDLLTNNKLMQFGNMPGLGLFSRFVAVVVQSVSEATYSDLVVSEICARMS